MHTTITMQEFSDWYFIDSVYVYGRNAGEAIDSFMLQNYPGELYRWFLLPRHHEMVIMLMDHVGKFKVSFKVSRALGAPGVKRAHINAVCSVKHAFYTPVPSSAMTQINIK